MTTPANSTTKQLIKLISNILINGETTAAPSVRQPGCNSTNHTIVKSSDGEIMISYNCRIILKTLNGQIFLGYNHNCSTTTTSNRNKYLGLSSKEINAKIKSGKIQIFDLDNIKI